MVDFNADGELIHRSLYKDYSDSYFYNKSGDLVAEVLSSNDFHETKWHDSGFKKSQGVFVGGLEEGKWIT